MHTIATGQALRLVEAAIAEARQQNWRPMAVVVVDAAGQVVASVREPGASALRLDIALGKAAAAVGMGVNSRALAQRAAEMPVFFGSIAAVAQQKFVPQTGAVLLMQDGQVLGAAGSSGGTGDEDERICIAGASAVGLATG